MRVPIDTIGGHATGAEIASSRQRKVTSCQHNTRRLEIIPSILVIIENEAGIVTISPQRMPFVVASLYLQDLLLVESLAPLPKIRSIDLFWISMDVLTADELTLPFHKL